MSEFKEALEKIEEWTEVIDEEGLDIDGDLKHYQTAIKALRIADKLLNESNHPTAINHGYYQREPEYYAYNKGVEHMRQHLKELEDEN